MSPRPVKDNDWKELTTCHIYKCKNGWLIEFYIDEEDDEESTVRYVCENGKKVVDVLRSELLTD